MEERDDAQDQLFAEDLEDRVGDGRGAATGSQSKSWRWFRHCLQPMSGGGYGMGRQVPDLPDFGRKVQMHLYLTLMMTSLELSRKDTTDIHWTTTFAGAWTVWDLLHGKNSFKT